MQGNLTFEEFFKGILDFPDILEQFSGNNDDANEEDDN